ncbi:hypothetical protein A3A21_04110 [Candidatus Jorgensenbacteria bacterium RIFCSPLOWO2_01_FULL_45_25b]|uniref:DUF4134 domain-containing protein n=1 Tax=Candidatus Jorgensenbacteria bacterium RIFCSPLOWO2_01_FULL_45_25b TaxID=1798471 RepID=A0A1F6BXR1_9BACT|nr:MAG: hypothetical protein A3A21_04110 [Candidatus Jorgensenbacteria bacterium RIFCSPLOWO2_01_FULL_45_25b]
MQKKIKNLSIFTTALLASIYKKADAATDSLADIIGILQNVVDWAQVFFYVIAVLYIILGAWDYLNSGGDEGKVKDAKNKLLYSLVAIAIAVIAGGVVNIVVTFVN